MSTVTSKLDGSPTTCPDVSAYRFLFDASENDDVLHHFKIIPHVKTRAGGGFGIFFAYQADKAMLPHIKPNVNPELLFMLLVHQVTQGNNQNDI